MLQSILILAAFDRATARALNQARASALLFNLLSNAVKFTEHGAVTLGAKTDGDMLEITVSDTGIGIAPEQHDLIFEKFQQADPSTSRRFGGTGLGLAICRNLAGAMEGSVGVISLPNEGATFTVRLPLRLLEATVDEAEAADRAGVLLLLPNLLAQRIVARNLGEEFGAVEAFVDGSQLMVTLRGRGADYVILQADAVALDLEAIVAAAKDCHARTIILVAPEDEMDLTPFAAADAEVLQRPVAGDTLVAALRNNAKNSRRLAAG